MIRKFHSAYRAAENAATIATRWTDAEGKSCDAKNLRGYMGGADSRNSLDTEDLSTYYFVNTQGDIGFTDDDGETVMWIFRNADTRKATPSQAQTERPQPIVDTPRPASSSNNYSQPQNTYSQPQDP